MRKAFDVYIPKWLYKLTIITILTFSIIPIIFCLVEGFNLICIITFAILFIIPFLIAAIWCYRFRVIVRKDTITVKSAFRKKYSFNVSEITKVIRTVVMTRGAGINTKIKVCTKYKHVTVELLMIGSDKFYRYIEENVSPEKIITKVYKRAK